MARPLRIIYEGAWYHVMNRGAAKKNIFHSDEDRNIFLTLLERIHERFKIEIHAYCLMDNHYHLLVRTPLPNLSQAIKYLNGSYVQKHNILYQIDGPLFRGRFKSIVVEDDDYLLYLTRYIHHNPVAAKISDNPWDYPWSSCKDYLCLRHPNTWLYVDAVLAKFVTTNDTKKYLNYIEFLCDDINEQTIRKIKNSLPVIGGNDFISEIAKKFTSEIHFDDDIPDKKILRKVLLPSFREITAKICEFYKIEARVIYIHQKGKPNLYRDITIYLGTQLGNMSLNELGNEFKDIKKTTISLAYRKMLKKIAQNWDLKKDIEKISSNISKIEM